MSIFMVLAGVWLLLGFIAGVWAIIFGSRDHGIDLKEDGILLIKATFLGGYSLFLACTGYGTYKGWL